MPILRITKGQVEDARRAREKALKTDSEFRQLEEAREHEHREVVERAKTERLEQGRDLR